MFMRENRKKNGAYQPGLPSPGAGNAARKISPNLPVGQNGENWKFTPDLSSPEAINKAHYMGGLSGDGPYKEAYGSDIPFVGVDAEKKTDSQLKG